MAAFTNALSAGLLNLTMGGVSTASLIPGTLYLGLFTVAPTDVGGGTEVSTGSYVRKSVVQNTTNWPNATEADPAVKKNGVDISFVTASADWGTIVAVGLFNASSSGTLLAWTTLTPNRAVNNGDTVTFAANSITFTLT